MKKLTKKKPIRKVSAKKKITKKTTKRKPNPTRVDIFDKIKHLVNTEVTVEFNYDNDTIFELEGILTKKLEKPSDHPLFKNIKGLVFNRSSIIYEISGFGFGNEVGEGRIKFTIENIKSIKNNKITLKNDEKYVDFRRTYILFDYTYPYEWRYD